MNKVAHYLQEHIVGEVLTSSSARKFFATDASIFTITPSLVVYPKNESDVRKVARFTWQLAERGRVLPITPRGLGSDKTGSAIGRGVILSFPGHMNRILEYDGKTGNVTVEPGINFDKLQQTLHTHGRFLPPYPSALETSTLGGGIANNTGGEKSVKYGNVGRYVKALRVVLANGEVIETKRLNKRELNKKMGLASFEGEIYRSVDALLEENKDLIKQIAKPVTKNTAGYNLANVKLKDGSIDLTPLFVGSEGTLGIITEAELSTELYNPNTTTVAAMLDDAKLAEDIINELAKMSEGPSVAEVIDGQLLEIINEQNPNQLKGLVEKPTPQLVLLLEFDNLSQRTQKRAAKKVQKLFKQKQIPCLAESNEDGKEKIWRIRHAAAVALANIEGNAKPLPVLDDGIVPKEKFNQFLSGIYTIFSNNRLKSGVWGHLLDANLHLHPLMDLSQVGDRQKIFRIVDEYYRLVIELGGSTSGEHGDGRLRAAYLPALYGPEVYTLFQKIKQIFDPYGTLNPGVKINVTLDDVKPLLRDNYSFTHAYNHLPHS